MVQSQFSLTWDKYRDNICKGFTSLQHNGEFVDMTIAAEGHLVKVHQIVIALASPYFKELLKSAPCQHPVIFLNNVSHSVLCHILEYIYTGEVILQAEELASFCDTAKALQICGMDDVIKGDLGDSTIDNVPPTIVDADFEPQVHMSGLKTIGISSGDKVDKVNLPTAARKIKVKVEKGTPTNFNTRTTPRDDFSEPMEDDNVNDDDYNDDNQSPPENTSLNIQFTASNRGCLQLILNRYLYNFHSIASRTGVRRWRCVDYRNSKCGAIVATKGNVVVNRVNLHNHPFHDKKILLKVQRKSIYSALDDVKGIKNLPKPGGNDHKDDDGVLEDETMISNIT